MARRQKTFLCVDDNQSSLKICKMVLEDFSYKVLTSSSAREGLEIFASNAIETVILDYQIPEMNGELVAAENETDESANSHSHPFRLDGTARKRASTSGRICRQRRSGRLLAPGSSASVES